MVAENLLNCDECASLILAIDARIPHFIDELRANVKTGNAIEVAKKEFALEIVYTLHKNSRHEVR